MGKKNSLEIIYLGGMKNSLKTSESYWEDLLNLQVFHMFAWNTLETLSDGWRP